MAENILTFVQIISCPTCGRACVHEDLSECLTCGQRYCKHDSWECVCNDIENEIKERGLMGTGAEA